jgi:hypothetical protein
MICIFVKNWSQKETAELSCVPMILKKLFIEEGDLVKNKEDAIESILYLMREYKINKNELR